MENPPRLPSEPKKYPNYSRDHKTYERIKRIEISVNKLGIDIANIKIALEDIGIAKRSARQSNEIVKLIISNLPETVVKADLQELFQDFDVSGTAVHYDENGAHLGTADLYANILSAQNIVREYANYAIDGRKIHIAIENEDEDKLLKPKIQDQITRVASNPIRQHKTLFRRRIRRVASNPIRQRKTLFRRRIGGNRGSDVKLKNMSVDDLDKELEDYMSNRNADGN